MNLAKRYTILLSVLFIMPFIFNMAHVNANSSFPDVNDRNQKEVDYLISKEVINGFPDGSFKPNQAITRADAVAMIGRALEFNKDQKATSFPDVAKKHYASGYIAQAVNQGIIQGHDNGTFKPNEHLSRGQMSLIIDRAFPGLVSKKQMKVDFYDIESRNFEYDSIRKIASSGISNGYPDGTFQLKNDVTRMEMVLFLSRAMNESFRVDVVDLEPQPLIAKTKTAQETNQIITVVSTGGGNAKIEYWKKSSGFWKKDMSTNGFVGQQGVTSNKKEGDRKAPTGSFKIPFAFGTENPITKMSFRPITRNSYWISNVNDRQYNTWQEKSSSSSADEHLIKYASQYKYAMAIDYNMNNPVRGDGSAIFLHVSNGTPTLGCVSIPESNMRYLMQELGSNARIIITDSESNIAKY